MTTQAEIDHRELEAEARNRAILRLACAEQQSFDARQALVRGDVPGARARVMAAVAGTLEALAYTALADESTTLQWDAAFVDSLIEQRVRQLRAEYSGQRALDLQASA